MCQYHMMLSNTHTHAVCLKWWVLPVSDLNYHHGRIFPLFDLPKACCSSIVKTFCSACLSKCESTKVIHFMIKILIFLSHKYIFSKMNIHSAMTIQRWYTCTTAFSWRWKLLSAVFNDKFWSCLPCCAAYLRVIWPSKWPLSYISITETSCMHA